MLSWSVHDRDERSLVEALLEVCLKGAKQTWAPALEEACRTHPELANRLRRTFENVLALQLESGLDPSGSS